MNGYLKLQIRIRNWLKEWKNKNYFINWNKFWSYNQIQIKSPSLYKIHRYLLWDFIVPIDEGFSRPWGWKSSQFWWTVTWTECLRCSDALLFCFLFSIPSSPFSLNTYCLFILVQVLWKLPLRQPCFRPVYILPMFFPWRWLILFLASKVL